MLSKYEKQLLGMARKRVDGVEWLRKNHPDCYKAGKKISLIKPCAICSKEIVARPPARKLCEECRVAHKKSKAREWKQSKGVKVFAEKEAYLEAGWFTEETLNDPRFDGFLGVVDKYQCYLKR